MTGPMGSTELAKFLYEAWRRRQDMLNPAQDDRGRVRNFNHRLVQTGRDRPRPRWEHLDTLQQGVWQDVAVEACKIMADAMGAA